MPAVIIRDMQPQLHRRLKEIALLHHRSMNREILAILEKEAGTGQLKTLPPPVKGLKPVDSRYIVKIMKAFLDHEGTAGAMKEKHLAYKVRTKRANHDT